jgi:hypothetical protein
MNQSVLVTDPLLVEAVRNGDVIGEIYSDSECYADFESASHWLREQPIASLEKSAGIES